MDDNITSDVFSLEDQQRLEFTNKLRKKLIETLVTDEDKPGIPQEKADKALLVSLLDGMDRTTLSKAKIKTEDKAVKGNADATNLIAEVLRGLSTNQKQKAQSGGGSIPTLPSDVKFSDVEGETQLGTHGVKIDEFMQKQRQLED